MYLPTRVQIADWELEGVNCEVELLIDQTSQGIRPTFVSVRSASGEPITSTTLRAVRVWEVARNAIVQSVMEGAETTHPDGRVTFKGAMGGGLSSDDAVQLRLGGPTEVALGWVAHVYNMAEVLGLPPARQVELELGLPRTTASKWVRRARERGLIGGEHSEEA